MCPRRHSLSNEIRQLSNGFDGQHSRHQRWGHRFTGKFLLRIFLLYQGEMNWQIKSVQLGSHKPISAKTDGRWTGNPWATSITRSCAEDLFMAAQGETNGDFEFVPEACFSVINREARRAGKIRSVLNFSNNVIMGHSELGRTTRTFPQFIYFTSHPPYS